MKEVSTLHQQFIDNCRDIVARQSDVTINEAAVEAFAMTIQASTFVPEWKDYISAAAQAEPYDFRRVFYEMAMLTAQQGGFIYEDAAGQPRKWQQDGSGAKAMVAKMAAIRESGALPFYQIGADAVEARIGPLLAGVPFAEKRLEIFREFADAGNHRRLMELLDQAFDGTQYKIDMAFVEKMAAIFPLGLGEDPFRKKALLTPLLAAANAAHHGVGVDTSDLVAATDYVLPQVLNADGVGILSFSPALTEKLENRQAFAENAGEVAALRAATALVCERLIALSGRSAQEVDSFLWLAGRKPQNARPHMLCYTLRF